MDLCAMLLYLHSAHGLPELFKLMCRGERLQLNISQFHVLLLQFLLQIHHGICFVIQPKMRDVFQVSGKAIMIRQRQ